MLGTFYQPPTKQEASMKRINKQIQEEELFVGIDLHKRRWHVTTDSAPGGPWIGGAKRRT